MRLVENISLRIKDSLAAGMVMAGLLLGPAAFVAAAPPSTVADSSAADQAAGARAAVEKLKASLALEAAAEPNADYYIPTPDSHPGSAYNLPQPVSFTPLSKLGRSARPALQEPVAPGGSSNDQTPSPEPIARNLKLETSPTKSWPGLMEAQNGPDFSPTVNPSDGFTVSAPLIEKPAEGETIYLYRHQPPRRIGGGEHFGVMWSLDF